MADVQVKNALKFDGLPDHDILINYAGVAIFNNYSTATFCIPVAAEV